MNIRIFAITCAAVCTVFLGGCASGNVYRVALTPEVSAQLKASGVSGVVAVRTDEIGTSISESNLSASTGATSGLLGSLVGGIMDSIIDNRETRRSEAAAAGIRSGLLEYAFDQALVNAFSQRFAPAGEGAHALSSVVASKNTTVWLISQLAREASGDAVAMVFARHLLSPDFQNVILDAEAVVCAKSEALRAIATTRTYARQDVPVLYRNKIQLSWSLPESAKPEGAAKLPKLTRHSPPAKIHRHNNNSRKAYQAAWAKDGASAMRAALDALAVELAEVVYWDLGEPARENYANAPGIDGPIATRDFRFANRSDGLPGYLYRREGDRLWLRTRDGCIYVQSE